MFRLWQAFINTLNGLRWGFLHEPALRQELCLLAAALPLSFFIAPTVGWWLALIGSLLLVIVVELLNTGIEKLADHVTQDRHPQIKAVKDLGSAAVFMALLLAGMVWAAALWVGHF